MHGQDFRDINAIPSGWKLSAYSAVISSQLRQCHRSQGVLSQTGISRLGLQPQGEFPCSSMCSFSQLMITVVWGLGLVVWNPTIFFEKGLWVTMIKELPKIPVIDSSKCGACSSLAAGAADWKTLAERESTDGTVKAQSNH